MKMKTIPVRRTQPAKNRSYWDQFYPGHVPVVLTGTDALKWNALSEWTVDYLLRQKKIVSANVFKTPCAAPARFTGKERKAIINEGVLPPSKIDSVPIQGFQKMPTKEFVLKSIQMAMDYREGRPVEGFYISNLFTVGVEDPFAKRYLSPSEKFWSPKKRSSPPIMRAFFNSYPTMTSLHYDLGANFFVQISGNKSFYLVPPAHFEDMKVFPEISPQFFRSSLFDITDEKVRKRNPHLRKVPVYLAELSPGEALFVPTYWFHQVVSTSITPAIGVAIGSFDPERTNLGEELLQIPNPIQKGWPGREALNSLIDRHFVESKGREDVDRYVLYLYLIDFVKNACKTRNPQKRIRGLLLEGMYLRHFGKLTAGVLREARAVFSVYPEAFTRKAKRIIRRHNEDVVRAYLEIPEELKSLILAGYIEKTVRQYCRNESRLLYSFLVRLTL